MYEVLDKDTIKFEILPHLSMAKRGYVTKSDLSEVIQCILYKLKMGCQWHMLPISAIFTGRPLSYKSVYAHFRKWSWNGEWKKVWGIILSRYRSFLDMSSVDTKDARKERPPMPSMSQTGKAYRLPCLHLFRISTTTFTTSPRLFRICSQALELLVWLCRDSFSMQAQALTLHNSGRIANSGRYSQTWFSISEEECEEMTSCLMNCFTRRDTVLKGPTRGWTHTGNRFDTTQTSWEGWNYIAFILIFLKKIRKREKSR